MVLIKLIQSQPNRYKFEGATLFKFGAHGRPEALQHHGSAAERLAPNEQGS